MYTIACNKTQFLHCTTAIKRGGSGAATTRNFFCFRARAIGGNAKKAESVRRRRAVDAIAAVVVTFAADRAREMDSS